MNNEPPSGEGVRISLRAGSVAAISTLNTWLSTVIASAPLMCANASDLL